MIKLKYNFKIKEISSLKKYTAKEINIINVDYKFKKLSQKLQVIQKNISKSVSN